MPYIKVHENWEDYPSTATPLDQAALEQIETGIATATATAEAAETPAGAQAKANAAEAAAAADATAKANAAQAASQPLDADLSDIAALADADGDIIIRGAAGWERLPKSATATDVLTAGATRPGWAAAPGSGCRVYRSSSSSNVAANTPTVISWNAEQHDSGGYHDAVTNPERVTIPTGLGGPHVVAAFVRFSLINANKAVGLRLYKNGVRIILGREMYSPSGAGVEAFCDLNAGVLNLVAGDYLEVFLNHNDTPAPVQGGASGESSWFSVYRLGT